MAYFNFKLAEKNSLSPYDVLNLQLINQNRIEDLSYYIKNIPQDVINKYEELGYIEYIKGKPNQDIFNKIRLSKKGNSFLDTLEVAEVNDDDIKILNWLINLYNSEDKLIGNKKRILSGIANFRLHTGIEKNNLALLLKVFSKDEESFQYSKKLENLFFDSKNIFQRKFSLDSCKLYEYYLKNKDYFDTIIK